MCERVAKSHNTHCVIVPPDLFNEACGGFGAHEADAGLVRTRCRGLDVAVRGALVDGCSDCFLVFFFEGLGCSLDT